ncbi:cytochrome c oxidase subunit II [Azospirillum melinis]|uniref:cytochrome-c oxidase n=1 Tax=Azospirillum melinis TaxID=328839 RepID=A0ABX2K9D1_9PROT|nr:cytochrome c oxidase subunit II [Azospirillum melinis]MBP2310600.1 cytochrome c oxidase subunit 2 [Azospirillum melinis]NUA99066.1 cytochrome c oxidase subunit II [Azospirillum melinis]
MKRAGGLATAALTAAALTVLLTGCEGVQSALDPAGHQAGRIAGLWWLFLGVLTVIYLLVLAGLLIAAIRPRRRGRLHQGPAFAKEPPIERRLTRGLTAWAVGTGVIILTLTGLSYAVDRDVLGLTGRAELEIEVTAKQWWWQVKYNDPVPSRSFETANEIRLPVGVPVRVVLKSQDVIHSFWVPNLHGKTDLIPGRVNETTLTADREGRFRGQCAEFCGFQHANMALDVLAMPRDRFDAWRAAQLSSAPAPGDALQEQGRQVFLSSACVMCHTIHGTSAASRVGPDLTHVAGRLSLAAGTLPYNKGNLAGWIADPQRIKPGTRMPVTGLSPDQLQGVVAYLDSLK